MEGNKLDIAGKENKDNGSPVASYKPIAEEETEKEQLLARPKSLSKSDSKLSEPDGADEKMLAEEDAKIPNSNINISEVKFTNNEKQNGDAKLDIGEVKSEFVGMSKEELMKYANDPFWVRLRWFLFILFWLLWTGMLVGAVLIIVAAPKCSPAEPKTWWEEGPLIELEDEGLLQNIDSNNIKAAIIPYPDDIYNKINSNSTFVKLLTMVKEKGMKVIVELSPMSDLWFTLSESKDDEYKDFYIWHKGEPNEPPNNWLSTRSVGDTKISAWNYSAIRNEYYYQVLGKPLLNFRWPAVADKFSDSLKEFIQLGVAGVSLKDIPYLLVNENFDDEIPRPDPVGIAKYGNDNYNYYLNTKTKNVDGLGLVLQPFRELVKNLTENGVFMLSDNVDRLEAFKVDGKVMIDLPKYSYIFGENRPINATRLQQKLNNVKNMIEVNWPAWEVNSNVLPSGILETVAYLLKGSLILNNNVTFKPELQEVRNSPSIILGSQHFYTAANNTVFAYVRVQSGNPGYLVALNPTNTTVTVDFPKDIPAISEEVTVQYLSENYNATGVVERLKKDAHTFPMSPESLVVLSYIPKSKD